MSKAEAARRMILQGKRNIARSLNLSRQRVSQVRASLEACFCGKPAYCRGLCRSHYERQRRGLPLVPLPPEPSKPPPPCELCGEVHDSRRRCEPIPTSSKAPPVRIDRKLKPELDEIGRVLGLQAGAVIAALMKAAEKFRKETGRTLEPVADIEAPIREQARGKRKARPLPAVGNRVDPQVRLTPAAWEEASEISRGLNLKHGLRAGRSAAGGIRGMLKAASIFRQCIGRPLVPQDIDEAARRVASRRRKGAGNG